MHAHAWASFSLLYSKRAPAPINNTIMLLLAASTFRSSPLSISSFFFVVLDGGSEL